MKYHDLPCIFIKLHFVLHIRSVLQFWEKMQEEQEVFFLISNDTMLWPLTPKLDMARRAFLKIDTQHGA